MSPSEISYLATLPSLDELRAKVIAVIQAPATKLGNGGQGSSIEVSTSF